MLFGTGTPPHGCAGGYWSRIEVAPVRPRGIDSRPVLYATLSRLVRRMPRPSIFFSSSDFQRSPPHLAPVLRCRRGQAPVLYVTGRAERVRVCTYTSDGPGGSAEHCAAQPICFSISVVACSLTYRLVPSSNLSQSGTESNRIQNELLAIRRASMLHSQVYDS